MEISKESIRVGSPLRSMTAKVANKSGRNLRPNMKACVEVASRLHHPRIESGGRTLISPYDLKHR